ncbi:MAG: tRNA (adenosine(37)-N6)-threonylcarbamoyltransferase complex dimerization subunit type 1 TsaB, partial [Treponema sp.]|nr:tRNA (adenosine(37)-N6)-threonylcarbamoyltransferase complex dimerization subunit type 1 TsaB [Treponema sp.]
MNALAIDCAVSKLCIAAKKENQTVKLCLDIGTKQSEKILPAIDYVLKEADLTPALLDYTAVTLGPGTFTGLRLGLSALKALNLANGTPLYGIPSLKAYALPYKSAIETVLSVIEEKEDQYFYSFYAR